MESFFSELKSVRKSLEEWKKSLPIDYDAIPVPVPTFEFEENPNNSQKYPYEQRLDYVTSTNLHFMNSNTRLCRAYHEPV
jgi:hypothetical protein